MKRAELKRTVPLKDSSIQPRARRMKACAVCKVKFTPVRDFQSVCGEIACAIAHAPANQARARKAIDQRERREIKVRKEKLKSRADHLKDTQTAVNEYIRWRDKDLPCVSCGRFHGGQWHAGHFRSAGGHPELRFVEINIWRQCAPCNTHKSGDLINYRAELVRRIGEEKVLWLEGPHEPKKYTVEQLKALTAEYRAKTRELKRGSAA